MFWFLTWKKQNRLFLHQLLRELHIVSDTTKTGCIHLNLPTISTVSRMQIHYYHYLCTLLIDQFQPSWTSTPEAASDISALQSDLSSHRAYPLSSPVFSVRFCELVRGYRIELQELQPVVKLIELSIVCVSVCLYVWLMSWDNEVESGYSRTWTTEAGPEVTFMSISIAFLTCSNKRKKRIFTSITETFICLLNFETDQIQTISLRVCCMD